MTTLFTVDRLFTVGHGARTLEELVDVLRDGGVRLLADVRRFPGSRRHPHFARESLERALPEAGLAYEWWGETLGGRRSSKKKGASRHPAWRVDAFRAYADWMDGAVFREALATLEAEARETPLAVMCAETLWWQCHRRLISDSLTLDGFEVVHLLGVGKHQKHVLHPQLRRDEKGLPVYDKGITPALF